MERLLTLYSEVQSTDVRWLWYPFIAIGKITLLQGDPGDGKSTMMMNLIAELSTGGKTPDGCKIGTPQKVIYQCSEDGVSDTIKPRLERCGADCKKIAFINEEVYNGLSYDQRIMTGQYPVADLMGYRHTKDGRLVIEPEEAKTVRFIFLAFIQGYNYDQIAAVLTQKKRSTLRGRQEWNGMMVANIMKNERRWGDLEARKSIVVDYKLGKVTKNNGNRCSAYVPEHHEAIVSPEIARAAHLVASSSKKCGVQDIVVIRQGALKGFVGIHPNWSGINAESIRSLCLSTYLPEEVMKLNDIAEMRAGATLGKALQSEYMTVSGTCFINQSSPVMTISKNGIRFSKACHSRLDDCEYVELLYHPILQVVILRKSNHGFSTAMHWRDDNDVHSVFSARAFSGLVFQTLNWKMNYRYQCRGICRGQGNAKFLIFELDESRILTGRNQYEQENCSMNLKCRLYRSKWVQSITVNDVMESGQVVENPMIGAIPSKNEVQRELDDLLMSM